MVQFYQRSIVAWMDGTEGLDDGEYRVYDVICNLVYLNNGPIVAHEVGIAGRCKQHPLRFRANLAKLIERKKIVKRDDGKLTNLRVEQELKRINAKRKPQADPKPTPASPPPGGPGVGRGSAEGQPNKPLKNNDTAGGRVVPNTIQDNTIKNPPLPPRGGARASKTKKKQSIADDFLLTSELESYAVLKGFTATAAAEMFEAFAGHHRAKGTQFVDWKAAWQNWVRNEVKFNGKENTVARRGGGGAHSLTARLRVGIANRATAAEATILDHEPAPRSRPPH